MTMHVKHNGPGEFLVQSEDGTRRYTVRKTDGGVMVTDLNDTIMDDTGSQFAEVLAAMTAYTEQQRVDVAKLMEIRDQIRVGQCRVHERPLRGLANFSQ